MPPKKCLPKNPSKILQNNFKNSLKIPPKNPPKNPKNLKQFLKKVNFENIQLPISHLEAENPFGLVLKQNLKFGLVGQYKACGLVVHTFYTVCGLLIINCSWILTVHKARILRKKAPRKNIFDLQKVGLKYTNRGL